MKDNDNGRVWLLYFALVGCWPHLFAADERKLLVSSDFEVQE
jgi:hypothetical protein